MLANGWASQLIRNIFAAQLYAQQNNFHLVIHGVYYAEGVKRSEVHKSDAWINLLRDLGAFRNKATDIDVTADDEMMLITTELLRFGDNSRRVKEMTDLIERLVINGKSVQVFTLKEVGIDRMEALQIWTEMANSSKSLGETVSHKDAGKDVKIDPAKKKERKEVEDRAAEIVKHCRKEDSLPDDLEISFRLPTPKDVKVLIDQYFEAQKEMKQGSKSADDAISSILNSLDVNPTLSASSTGRAITMYMRTSESTARSMIWIDVTDSQGNPHRIQVPRYQLCHNIALLEKQLVGRKQGGKVDVIIYYDHFQSRDEERCNHQFALLADSIFRKQVALAVTTKSNRVSSHLHSIQLLQCVCAKTGTELFFSQQIGQNDYDVATAEDKRRGERQGINDCFNKKTNILRNRLEHEERERSLEFLSIACGLYFESDKKTVIGILRANGFNDQFIQALDARDKAAAKMTS